MSNCLIVVATFFAGLIVFAFVLALAGVAWIALGMMRMDERYRADSARARAAIRRGARISDHKIKLP